MINKQASSNETNVPSLAASAALITNPDQPVDPRALRDSLDQHRQTFASLGETELIAISIDVAGAGMLVLKRAPDWLPYLPRIEQLPGVNVAAIVNLPGYAEALLQANTDFMTTVNPPAELTQLLEEGDELRDALREDAQILERRGLLPSGALDQVKGASGYKNTAVELSALATVLADNWAQIAGKTAVTQEELDRANVIAQRIFRNASDRDARHPSRVQAALLRQQAFTAVHRAYDELRRCIAFLVPDEKLANAIAPSFYQGRGGRVTRAEGPEVGPSPESTDGDVTPQPTPAASAAGPNALPSNNPFSA